MTLTDPRPFAFELPPPMAGLWHDLSPELAGLLSERMLDRELIDADMPALAIRVTALSCYPGHFLADAQLPERDGHTLLHNFVYGATSVVHLNGRSPPIQALNWTGAPRLANPDAQSAYFRFF